MSWLLMPALCIALAGCADSETPTTQESGSLADANADTSGQIAGDTITGDNVENSNGDLPSGQAELRKVVSFDAAAAAKLESLLAEHGGAYIRVSATPVPDSTYYKYGIGLDDAPLGDRDYLDTSHGFQVVVDRVSAPYLQDTEINWETNEDGGQGFRFDNPNAKD